MATSCTETVSGGSSPHPHGVKRAAVDALENEQRLSKRFNLLNLDTDANSNANKLDVPVSPAATRHRHRQYSPPPKPRLEPVDDELMQVEDTPNRVFIYDLDKELADIESDEENPIFLADIEKHLTKIPRHILMSEKDLKATEKNQLILYNVPTSLSVPQEQDNVRKAIVEARARIREGQAFNTNNFGSETTRVKGDEGGEGDEMALTDNSNAASHGHSYGETAAGYSKHRADEDPEAMDVEEEL